MLKRLTFGLVFSIALLLFLTCSASATNGTYEELTWELDNEGTLLISGTGEMEGFLADSTDAWRPYELDIKKVIISNGVKSIGMYAFEGCSFLTTVSIPNTVKKIGMCAFSECISLESISIPDSVVEIGSSAFYKCKKLTNVSLPKTLEIIDNHTFLLCESLKHIQIPKTVRKIKRQAFSGCKKLQNINLPEGLTEIEAEAFFICYELNYLSLPQSLRKIGDYAFYNCRNIQNVYYSGSQDDKENIIIGSDNSTFQTATWHYEVNEKNTIRLASGTVTVEENAFENTAAAICIIPEGVKTIKAGSFSNMKNVAKIYLPSSLTSIDNSAFDGLAEALFICPNSSCPAYQWAVSKGLNVSIE